MSAAFLSVLLLVLGGAPGLTPDEGTRTIAELSARNAGIRSYTFDLHVHIVVHMFPEVRFGLDGQGEYRRPSQFFVRFKKVPWFGKSFERINLGPLDPTTWPKQYTITVAQHDGDVTVLSMRDRVKSNLTEARATIDARDGLRQLVWLYNYGGRIQLDVRPREVSGFPLPEAEDASIKMPNVSASAHADFTNYRVEVDEAANAP